VIAKTARVRERAALEVLTDANIPAVDILRHADQLGGLLGVTRAFVW
jgi:hypothetical protein